jgi:predicted nuclease of restriction endonuclease-like (RecB) superfamily
MATTLNLIGVRGWKQLHFVAWSNYFEPFFPKKLHHKIASSLGILGSGYKLPNQKIIDIDDSNFIVSLNTFTNCVQNAPQFR